MIRPSPNVQAYLYMEPVDMRKSIDGLAALVENELELSPMLEALFVFRNRGRDKIKLLYWERNGFVVWYKRLEKQRFRWPRQSALQRLPYWHTVSSVSACMPVRHTLQALSWALLIFSVDAEDARGRRSLECC